MRPVNLLPAKNRPHQPSGSRSGSSYVILGALALLLAAVVTYVLETNKITQAKNDIAVAEQKTADARARAQQLGPFGDFAKVADQRVASVKQLADGRFDWERSVRELAHLLPNGVWLQDFNATIGGSEVDPSATAAAPTATPSIMIHGCATRQPDVAVTLVRLREMEGVTDVVLKDSKREVDNSKTSETDSAGSDSTDCGTTNGNTNYDFNAVVTFEAVQPVVADPTKGSKVPVRLGGGS